MVKKIIPLAMVGALLGTVLSRGTTIKNSDSSIIRLTHSGNNVVKHPCLSQDGRWMLYTVEMKEGDKEIKAIRIMNCNNGEEKEVFRDGSQRAPAPFSSTSLVLGTKPPLLSSDGKTAVFALGLDKPHSIMDHYLGIADLDGTSFEVRSFPMTALKEMKELRSFGFENGDWERLSNYAMSADGRRIACAVKGHLGPRRYGYASGIVLLDRRQNTQETILAPDFSENGWTWPGYPRRALTGGGWAFGLSGDGRFVLFGAQSSEDMNDYDLYVAEWGKLEPKRITDFHDRWFSLADISHDGTKIVFFYTGKKNLGMGTYTVQNDGKAPVRLESKIAPRIEFLDMSADGRFVLYKHIYSGLITDLRSGTESVAYDDSTQGYEQGILPMEFPPFPSFWTPRILSYDGSYALLIGGPAGKDTAEIYLLHIDID